MAEQDGIYKCEVCGIVVSIIEAHGGVLSCCGEPMKLQEQKTKEQEGKEKHVPIIKIEGNNVTVTVGDVPHPMEEGHFIELIQLIKDGKVIKGHRLKPGDAPVANFCLENTEGISAREVCNLHGVWVS